MKKLLHTLYHEKTRKISFSHENATQNFYLHKKPKQNFIYTWPEHLTTSQLLDAEK